jgi:hypothetical protein
MQTIWKGNDMLRLLIPVVHHEDVPKAARCVASLFVKRCVAGGELAEDLERHA